jgi:N-acetylneuraminic acid mutarotase
MGEWTQLSNNNVAARRNHSACNINDKIYYFGGIDNGSNQLNDLWEYNPLSQGTNIYTKWEYVTAYKNGALIFGKEPVPVTLDIDNSEDITVEFHNSNTLASSNIITGHYKITNNSSVNINLADIKLRYYYTKDKDVAQQFFCDHADIMYADGGNYTAVTSLVNGIFVNMSSITPTADTYLEISYGTTSHNIPANGGIATIYTRIARADWTNYNMLNDYSYLSHWKPRKSCTVSMSGHTASVVNGNMYAYNGTTNGMWKYTPTTDTWSQITGCPTIGINHSAVSTTDKIYYFGGYSVTPTNELWEYTPSTDTWLQKTSCPVSLYKHTAVLINNKMYVFGGYNSGYLNVLWVYDLNANTWQQFTSGATARREHTATVINNEMYIFGGYDGTNYLNDLWKYNPSTDTWQQLSNGATIRSEHTSVMLDGKMYVFGGYNGNDVLNDLWIYDYSISNIYYKYNNEWKQAIPYIKINGEWKQANMNANISGDWK